MPWLLAMLLVLLAVPAAGADAIAERLQSHGEACVFVRISEPAPSSGFPLSAPQRAARRLRLQQLVMDQLPPGTFEVRYRFRYSAVCVLRLVHQDALDHLRAMPEVLSLELDTEGGGALDESRPLVGGDAVLDLGLNGTGVVVAVLDSGIDQDHPAFEGALVAEHRFLGQGADQGPSADDAHGHGSHVSGVIASAGRGGAPLGLAPGVSLVAIRVLNESNRGWVSDWVAGLEHVVQLHEEDNGIHIDVVNMSLATNARFDGPCGESYAAFQGAAAAARAHGIVLLAASGNSGSKSQLTSPACLEEVFSVGMSTKTLPESIVRLSNRNEHLDLVAPGEDIVSVEAGGESTMMTGTSFACPHVAGAAAILREIDPELSPDEILQVLKETATPITDTALEMTFPRVDVLAAVSRVASDCDEDGVPDVVALRQQGTADCNLNRVPDACDIASGDSSDSNEDGVPDECDGRLAFRRGDADIDGELAITDAVAIVNRLFLGTGELRCLEAADVNDDAILLVTDPIRLVSYLFLGGPPPAAPGPACGLDPSTAGSADDLGCAEYSCF